MTSGASPGGAYASASGFINALLPTLNLYVALPLTSGTQSDDDGGEEEENYLLSQTTTLECWMEVGGAAAGTVFFNGYSMSATYQSLGYVWFSQP